MAWSIELSKKSQQFLDKHKDIEVSLIAEIRKLVNQLQGETVSIDIKKLKGTWEGYHRIRKGQVRIIVYIDHSAEEIYTDSIDFRGNVY